MSMILSWVRKISKNEDLLGEFKALFKVPSASEVTKNTKATLRKFELINKN